MERFAKKAGVFFSLLLMILSLSITVYGVDNSVLKQTEAKLKTAESEMKKAESDYQKAVSDLTTVQGKIEKSKESLSELESRNWDNEVLSNYSKWQNALSEVTEKEGVYNIWKRKADDALIEYHKGSFGFFEYVGAEDALDVLRNEKYASYTNPDKDDDATNLDNMKNSFDFIRQCNEIRADEGVDPESNESLSVLKVTDHLMAVAQVYADYARTNTEHIHDFNIGENIAWGYKEPFKAWYDKEKEMYQSGNSDFETIGHYRNIVNAEYFTTGFAVAQGGSYSIDQVQTFYWEAENSMTVDEYESRFMVYYNKVTEEYNKLKPLLEKSKSELESIKSDVAEYEDEYNKSLDESSKAKDEIASIKQELESLEKSLPESKTKVSETKKLKEEKEKNHASLQSEYSSMKIRYEREQSALSKEESMKNGVSMAVSKEPVSQISQEDTSVSSTVSDINSSVKSDVSDDKVIESKQTTEVSDAVRETFNWSEINDQTGVGTTGMIVGVVALVVVGVLCIVFLRIRT